MDIEIFQGIVITLKVIRASPNRLPLSVLGHNIGDVAAYLLVESLFKIIHPLDDQRVLFPIQINTFIKQQYLLYLIVILNVGNCRFIITADELPLLVFKLLFYLGKH
jgi:hypothetical protein